MLGASQTHRFLVNTAFLAASIAAYLAAIEYSSFLLGGQGFTFGKTDSVFGRDVGFYAFDLPNVWIPGCSSRPCASRRSSSRCRGSPAEDSGP